MSNYILEECSSFEEWDEFVEESPQGSVFNKTAFITSVGAQCVPYFVKKGHEVVGGVSVALSQEGGLLQELPFAHYQNSILFRKTANQTHNKVITEHFSISELIINELVSTYRGYHAINSHKFSDLRPFLWYNYHNRDKGVFDNKLLYTAILDLHNKQSNTLVENLRTLRRRELRKEGDFRFEESTDLELLDRMHYETFSRQGIERSNVESGFIKELTSGAINHGFGKMTVGYVDGQPASAVLILNDTKRSYYLIGANYTEFRNTGIGTKLLFSKILETRDMGLREFDFVGANSPQRGDFKISFNAQLYPYYQSNLDLGE